jgi:pimeloyl-ACP methyl ester carboxylesterase
VAAKQESWSGYSLVRESLPSAPVIIPPLAPSGRTNFVAAAGAVRFWVSPNWTSGSGPGRFARLVELGDYSGTKPQVRWSLYVNESGDAIYLSGQTQNGAADLIKVGVRFEAGDWRLVTVCYSTTNTEIRIDGETVGIGEGILPPPVWAAANLGLVVGSDVLGLDGADAQFEELTTFAQWPSDSKWQDMYFQATKRDTLLGPLGTKEEELAKRELLQAAGLMMGSFGEPPPIPGGTNDLGSDPGVLGAEAYGYGTNGLWLEIISVTNGQAHVTLHGTEAGIAYEILSREILTNIPWAGEQMILGAAGQDWTPFLVPVGDRTNQLFLWARSYIDTDGDGLPDWWEMENGLDPSNPDTGNTGVSDGYKDGDNDGWTNLQEYQNGTNPNGFNTPAAPTGLMVTLSSGGSHAGLSWNRAAGAVTGYTIERSFDATVTTLSGNPGSYSDTQVVVPTDLFFEEPSYRIRAIYSTNGSSDWTPWICSWESRRSVVNFQQGGGGAVLAAANPVSPSATVLRVGKWDGGNPPLTVTNIDVPISGFAGGTVILPSAVISLLTNGPIYTRWISSNNTPSAASVQNVFVSIPFWDGRVHLKENLIFLLRQASSSTAFNYVRMPGGPSTGWILNPSEYAYSGLYKTTNLWDDARASFDYLLPFSENYRNRNFVFAPQDLGEVAWATGWLDTGVDWDGLHTTLWLPPKYEFDPPGGVTTIASLLGSSQWLLPNDILPHGGWDSGTGEYVDANYLSITGDPQVTQYLNLVPGVSNLFGLEYLSAKVTWGTNDTERTTISVGNSWPIDYSFYFFPEVAAPIFTNVGYYFGRVGTDWLPGHVGFSPTNQIPLLVAGIGQPLRIAGYARLAIANGYTNKFGYLGQYFDKAVRITNGVISTNETGILSPYGEFFATEPGPTAFVTMPDLDTNELGTGVVNVIKLQLDVNHDGAMELPFNSPDNTAVGRPFVFWVNNDYDRGHQVDCGPVNCDWEEDDLEEAGVPDYPTLITPDAAYATYAPFQQPTPRIASMRDLEDYARLWLPGMTALRTVMPTNYTARLTLSGNGQIRLFRAIEPDGGTDYLFDEATASNQVAQSASLFVGLLTSTAPITLGGQTNWGEHLIWCGAQSGTAEVHLQILDGNQNILADTAAYLEIKDIKTMYERWTVGDKGTIAPAATAYLAAEDVPAGGARFQYGPPSNANTPYILFVHGWNMERWEKDRFAEAAYKRLYWQGYEGRFGSFRWPTHSGFDMIAWQNPATTPAHFDRSESNAWASGPALKELLTTLNATSPNNVYLIAHSMGNVAAGEALRLAGTNLLVHTFVAMQAAMPSHAYDASAPIRSLGVLDSNTSNRYGEYWQSNSPPYFSGVSGAANYVNFYNPQDYALAATHWQLNQSLKPDSSLNYEYYPVGGWYFDRELYRQRGLFDSRELFFPTNTYELFSFCVEARCYALGAQQGIAGPFIVSNQANLFSAPYNFGQEHKGHSAQFRSTNMKRSEFWRTLLQRTDLTP